MNDRYRNERNRGESDWRERVRTSESGWREGNRQPLRAEGREPQYSSDEDETYGSEWTRGAGGFDRDRENSWDEGSRQRAGGRDDQARFAGGRGNEGRSRGQSHVGHYGSGGRGGYSGGYAGGGWGGSSGTSYERDDWNQSDSRGLGPSQGYGSSGGYGQTQGFSGGGSSYGGAGFGSGAERRFGRDDSSFGQGRGFGGGLDQGYRGRDFGSPGADLRTGGFAGRGPKGYTRTDDRIREDVCERLSQDDDVDASEIEVSVKEGEVTLRGTVITRGMKHDAEDIAEKVSGVRDVHNELRVMKGMLSELKDKLSGDDRNQHFAGSGTKNTPASGSASRSS